MSKLTMRIGRDGIRIYKRTSDGEGKLFDRYSAGRVFQHFRETPTRAEVKAILKRLDAVEAAITQTNEAKS